MTFHSRAAIRVVIRVDRDKEAIQANKAVIQEVNKDNKVILVVMDNSHR